MDGENLVFAFCVALLIFGVVIPLVMLGLDATYGIPCRECHSRHFGYCKEE